MGSIFYVFGLLGIVGSFFAITTVRSDIQVQIVVTLFTGGLILVGIGSILGRLERMARIAAGKAQPTAPSASRSANFDA